MKLIAVVNEQVHQSALAEARQIRYSPSYSTDGLNSVLPDEVTSWVNKLWDPIEEALTSACRKGMESTRPIIDKILADLDTLCADMTNRAREVRAVISARLNQYLLATIDGALERVRANIRVGGQQLTMTSVTVEQKVNISTSLKMSLSEICEFVAEGEITLSAEYARA